MTTGALAIKSRAIARPMPGPARDEGRLAPETLLHPDLANPLPPPHAAWPVTGSCLTHSLELA